MANNSDMKIIVGVDKTLSSAQIRTDINAINESLIKDTSAFIELGGRLNKDVTKSTIESQINSITKGLKIDLPVINTGNLLNITGISEAVAQYKALAEAITKLNDAKDKEKKNSSNNTEDTKQYDTLSAKILKLTNDMITFKNVSSKAMTSTQLSSGGITYQQEIDNMIQALQSGEVKSSKALASMSAQFRSFKSEISAVGLAGKTTDLDALNVKMTKLTSQLIAFQNANSKAMTTSKLGMGGITFKQEIDEMIVALQSGKIKSEDMLRSMETRFQALQSNIKAVGVSGNTTLTHLASKFQKLSQWLGITMLTTSIARQIQGMFTSIVSLDTALVDLKKTFKGTNEELTSFYKTSNDVAKALGVTTTSVINSASAWSRLGYSTAEAITTMSQVSSIFTSISPDLDMTNATEGLVSMMKAFGIESENALDGIVSKINSVGNAFSISNGEIVTAMQRSSSALASANNTFEQAIALNTGAVEITRNAEVTSTALKTMSMRIRGYDEETEELSGDLINVTGEIADLTKTASNTNGISIFTDENRDTYKSTYDILKEISGIYKDLSDKSQAQLLEVLGGKRSAQTVSALIENFSQAEKSLNTMADSQGNAMQEMEIIYDSIDYKLNALKETLVGIAQDSITQDFLKGVIENTTQFLDACNDLSPVLKNILSIFGSIVKSIGNVSQKFGSLGAILPIIAMLKTFKGTGAFGYMANDLGNKLIPNMTLFGRQLTSVKENLANLKNGQGITLFQSLPNEISVSTTQLTEFNTKLSSLGIGATQKSINALAGTSFKNMDVATKEAGISILKLNSQLQQGTITQKQYEAETTQIISGTQKWNVANKITAVSTKVLGTAINMVLNMGIMLLVSAIIQGLSLIVNRMDNLKDKADETKSAYEKSTSELEEINKKLDESRSKIEEINKNPLEITNDEKLQQLKDQTAELEAQKKVIEQINEVNKKKSETASKKYVEKIMPKADNRLTDLDSLIIERDNILKDGVDEKEYKKLSKINTEISNINTQLSENMETLYQYKDSLDESSTAYQNILKYEERYSNIMNNIKNEYSDFNKEFVKSRAMMNVEDFAGQFNNEYKFDDSVLSMFDDIKEFENGSIQLNVTGNAYEQFTKISDIITQLNNKDDLTADEQDLIDILRGRYNYLSDIVNKYSDDYFQGIEAQASMLFNNFAKENPFNEVSLPDYQEWYDNLIKQANGNKDLEDSLKVKVGVEFPKSELINKSIQEMINSGTYTLDISKLKTEASKGQLNSDDFYGGNFRGLQEELYNAGISVDDFITSLYSMVDAEDEVTNPKISLDEYLEKSALAIDKYKESANDMTDEMGTISDAFEEQSEYGEIYASTIYKLIDAGYSSALSFDEETGSCTLLSDVVEQITNNKQELLLTELEQQQIDLVTKYDEEREALDKLRLSINSTSDAYLLMDKKKGLETLDGQISQINALITLLGNYKDKPSKSSSSGKDAVITAFEKEYDQWQHDVALNRKSEAEMMEWLDGAYKSYFSDLTKYQDEYWKYEEEVYKWEMSHDKELFDKRIENYEKLSEKALDGKLTSFVDEKDLKNLEAFNKEMQKTYGLGNVDLTKRPKVNADTLRKSGYNAEDDETATVLSSFDFKWQGDEENGKYVAIHTTPILPDGTVLTKEELAKYVDETLVGSKDILKADKLGVVLKVDTDLDLSEKDIQSLETGKYTANIKKAMESCDAWDVQLHNVQADWLEISDAIDNIDVNRFEYATNQINTIISEIKQRISDIQSGITKGSAEDIEELEEQLETYYDKLDDINKETIESEKSFWENFQKEREAQLDAQIKAVEDAYDKQIAKIDAILDKMKEEQSAKKEAVALEKAQNDVIQARIDLENARQKVRTVISATGGTTYRQDDEKVKEAEQKLADAEQTEKDAKQSIAESKLEAEKTQLETEKDAKTDALEQDKTDIDTNVQAIFDILNKAINEPEQTTSNQKLWDEFVKQGLVTEKDGQYVQEQTDTFKYQTPENINKFISLMGNVDKVFTPQDLSYIPDLFDEKNKEQLDNFTGLNGNTINGINISFGDLLINSSASVKDISDGLMKLITDELSRNLPNEISKVMYSN